MAPWIVKHRYTFASLSVACAGLALAGFALWLTPQWIEVRTALAEPPSIQLIGQPIAPSPAAVPVEPSERVRLLFVGDIMLDRNVAARIRNSKNPAYPFSLLPNGYIAGFDAAIGNLEGPVTDRRRSPEKSIDFIFSPSVLGTLKEVGFDAFSQANNHALDQGAVGYEDSVKRLRAAGFVVFGHQVRDGSEAFSIMNVGGRKIALVGFNTTDNPLDRETAAKTLAEADAQADFVVVMPHWGPEYREKPHANEVELGHWFIDHGADFVVGGHPHWTQGFSSYKGKLIAWSLGNFVFDQDWSEETREGLALEVELTDGAVSVKPVLVRIDQSRPRLQTGDSLKKRLDRLVRISDGGLRDQVLAGSIRFEY